MRFGSLGSLSRLWTRCGYLAVSYVILAGAARTAVKNCLGCVLVWLICMLTLGLI